MKDSRANGLRETLVPARRRELIAELVRANGSVSVAALEAEFGVSAMTARRDLQVLEDEGLLRRTHGGAMSPGATTPAEDPFRTRLARSADAKARVGRAVAASVAEGEALFVDSSTTAYQAVVALLEAGRTCTILTNAIAVMDMVAQSDAPVTLVGLSGTLRRPSRSFVGPLTAEAIRRHFADKALFSVKGVTPDGGLTEADALEAEVKRLMIERARNAVLLVDGTKFEQTGINEIVRVDALHAAFVADATEHQLEPLRRAGVDIEEVPGT